MVFCCVYSYVHHCHISCSSPVASSLPALSVCYCGGHLVVEVPRPHHHTTTTTTTTTKVYVCPQPISFFLVPTSSTLLQGQTCHSCSGSIYVIYTHYLAIYIYSLGHLRLSLTNHEAVITKKITEWGILYS